MHLYHMYLNLAVAGLSLVKQKSFSSGCRDMLKFVKPAPIDEAASKKQKKPTEWAVAVYSLRRDQEI